MAPKKAKGKAIVAASTSSMPPAVECGPAIVGTQYSADIEEFRWAAASRHNEHGATSLTPARSGRHASGLYPFFVHFFFAGLVPLFSSFMEEILACYQICILHLHPNSILTLAIFAINYRDTSAFCMHAMHDTTYDTPTRTSLRSYLT